MLRAPDARRIVSATYACGLDYVIVSDQRVCTPVSGFIRINPLPCGRVSNYCGCGPDYCGRGSDQLALMPHLISLIAGDSQHGIEQVSVGGQAFGIVDCRIALPIGECSTGLFEDNR